MLILLGTLVGSVSEYTLIIGLAIAIAFHGIERKVMGIFAGALGVGTIHFFNERSAALRFGRDVPESPIRPIIVQFLVLLVIVALLSGVFYLVSRATAKGDKRLEAARKAAEEETP